MSSGFISSGTTENPRDAEWLAAQASLDASLLAAKTAAAQDGKSLYEVLQANKDKKQADFEEAARYKLHVSLDDDEAEYLAGLREGERRVEESVRREVREGVEEFRRAREEVERRALEGEVDGEGREANRKEEGRWVAAGRKRKKGGEGMLKGVKMRRAESASEENEKAKKLVVAASTSPPAVKKKEVSTAEAPFLTSVLPRVRSAKVATSLPSQASTNPLLAIGYDSSDEE